MYIVNFPVYCEKLWYNYTMDSTIKLPSGRARLAAVIGQAGDVVHIDDVVRILGLPRVKAAKLLSRWTKQGWLRRVGKGAYVAAPLDMLDSEQVVEDGWVLVPALFDPAYIGGRTAAEIWDLTEQIFRDILVFTTKPVRQKAVETGGVVFTLKHVDEENIFGCKTEWR
jgi:predicted transcriptional regulator of viral defense system